MGKYKIVHVVANLCCVSLPLSMRMLDKGVSLRERDARYRFLIVLTPGITRSYTSLD